MAIADCIGYLATSPPVPAGLEVPDSGLVGALNPLWIPTDCLDRCCVRVSRELDLGAGIGRPHRAALDPGSRNHRARTHRCQHRSRPGRFRLAEATGTETVDRPGAETDRA